MNAILRRLMPALGLAILVAGCGTSTPKPPTAPEVVPPLRSLVLAVHADTLAVGQARAYTATAVDTSGHVYSGALEWSSSDAGVVAVAAAGQVSAVGEGSAVVVAAGGGRRDSVRVLVLPVARGWTAQVSNATEDLNAVFIDPAGRDGWVVGGGGVILSTTDAGAHWTRRTPTTFTLHGVWFTSALDGWAVGDAGTILQTTDGGATWTRVLDAATSDNLMSVTFATPDLGWIVGSGGVVLRTTDGGATWPDKTYLLPLARPTLNAVMFAGPFDGWAVGDNGVIAGTHDGGDSWFVVQPAITAQALKGLWRRSVAQAVAVGAQGVAARTASTADSVAWTLDNAGNLNQLAGVCFPADTTGYAVGWNGTAGLVLRYHAAGAAWTAQTASAQFRLRGVYFVDALRGWAVGEGGTIRHTASGGE